MTKKLTELFELPQDEIDSLHIPIPENAHEITTDALSALEKIDQADLVAKFLVLQVIC